jgi:hypothetical protein
MATLMMTGAKSVALHVRMPPLPPPEPLPEPLPEPAHSAGQMSAMVVESAKGSPG